VKKTQLGLGSVAVTALLAAAGLAVPSSAAAMRAPDVIGSGFAGPLQIDIGHKNQIYVAQDFAGIVTKLQPNGTTKDIVHEQGEVAGVASRGYDVAYTFIAGDPAHPVALLKERLANGTMKTIADLAAYEAAHNPDARNVYGFRHLSKACAAQVPPEIGGEPYNGIVESHPYAVANAPGGGWYVADAAANDVLHVGKNGHVSVFGVLRPRKSIVTQDAADALGLPQCTVGEVYAFEPVPTDVEVKDTGALIVSLLPGGPEDQSLGARGALVRLAGDGEFANLATGFAGATNIALRPGGKIYVVELFAGRVSLFQNNQITTVRHLTDPAAIEFARGKLFATTDVFGPGNVISFKP
jgi:hypothetical protein